MKPKDIIQFWESKYLSKDRVENNFNLEPFLHGLFSAFSPGHSYHYVANFKTMQLRFVSESVLDFTGRPNDEVTFQDIISTAHPEQVEMVQRKEQVIYDFYFNYLPKDQVNRYKLVYVYKMIDPEGNTRVMLHQAMPLNVDSNGNLENALSVHTDVSYLRLQPDHSISFFSLDGRSSFVNINSELGKFDPESAHKEGLQESLTPREKEVVALLAKGHSSKEISGQLHVSVHTVNKHRKNILAKTQCTNTSELVGQCIMAGVVI